MQCRAHTGYQPRIEWVSLGDQAVSDKLLVVENDPRACCLGDRKYGTVEASETCPSRDDICVYIYVCMTAFLYFFLSTPLFVVH